MQAITASFRNPVNSRQMSGATIAILLFVVFVALGVLSWPILFSMELWIFRDRSSLLHLDYLIDEGHLIGVDIGYAYGLLPLLLQRIAFAVFGRGYWPMIGFIVATWGLMAVFWACVLRELGGKNVWLVVVVALSPLIIIVNPNFPYSLLQLSTLYSLLLVLYGKRNLALAVAGAGCFAIPSLSLVLSAFLASMILLDLHQRGQFTLRNVLAAFAPALIVGLLLLACMLYVFGISSILATLLPFQGMRIYRALQWGFMSSFLDFLWPSGRGLGYVLKYYATSPVLWWLYSTGLLLVLAGQVVRTFFHTKLAPWQEMLLLCAALHIVFVLFAYGHPDQHIIYDPILALGIIVGLAHMTNVYRRNLVLVIFVGLGILACGRQVNATWTAWSTTTSSNATAGLYASEDLSRDWQRVLQLASSHDTFLVSYATGVSHYYPKIKSADSWLLLPGVLNPKERDQILESIAAAEIVIEENGDLPPDVQEALGRMCLTETLVKFRIWQKPNPMGACRST